MKSTQLVRLRNFFRVRKSKATDDIERSEPETILQSTQDAVFGFFLAAVWSMVAYAFMTDQAVEFLARILIVMRGPFEERLAVLTAVLVLFADVLVAFAVAINREPGGNDIVDVVNDLGGQIDERFAEQEERMAAELAKANKRLDELSLIP